MGFRDAAARGRRLREEKAHLEDQAAFAVAPADPIDDRALARLYGVDPDGRGFAIYLGVLGVVIALGGAALAVWADTPDGILWAELSGFGLGLWGAAAYAVDARARRTMSDTRSRLRSLQFRFDLDDYERVATEFDHPTGWSRISIRFDEATLAIRPELRDEITDAMVGFGADATRWVAPDRLWIRSVTFDTSVSTKNASYVTARPIHAWLEPLLSRDLLDLHGSAPVTRVSVRFGFFSDGSFTVNDEDESDPSADAERTE